jgi:hypothetical protein
VKTSTQRLYSGVLFAQTGDTVSKHEIFELNNDEFTV